MAMNQKSGDQDEIVADINMTPLIDVMLVLLIIFMVTSSAALESGLNVSLPESNATTEAPPSSLVISLASNGDIAVAGEKCDLVTLKEKVLAGLARLKTTSVLLEGDSKSSLSNAFDVMNIAREAGAKDFSIAATAKD